MRGTAQPDLVVEARGDGGGVEHQHIDAQLPHLCSQAGPEGRNERLCGCIQHLQVPRAAFAASSDRTLHNHKRICGMPLGMRGQSRRHSLLAAGKLGATVKGDTMAAAAEEVYTKQPRRPLAFCTCRRACVMSPCGGPRTGCQACACYEQPDAHSAFSVLSIAG
jgi:hypothetical protein